MCILATYWRLCYKQNPRHITEKIVLVSLVKECYHNVPNYGTSVHFPFTLATNQLYKANKITTRNFYANKKELHHITSIPNCWSRQDWQSCIPWITFVPLSCTVFGVHIP